MSWGNGYTYRRSITIDQTLVPSDQTNFPIAVFGTYAYLATTGNGGDVTNSNGYDIIFCSDAAGSTMLDFELVTYTATTGAVEFWVRIPSLSGSVDTVIYMFYANASISTYQGNTAGVWNSTLGGVWHLPNGTTLTALDSTSNANNGSILSVSAGAGQVDGAGAFSGVSRISVGTGASINTSVFTLSCWLNPTGTTGYRPMWGDTTPGGIEFRLVDATNELQVLKQQQALLAGTVSTVSAGVWSHVVFTYDASGNYAFYINGAAAGSGTNLIALAPTSVELGSASGALEFWQGLLDEMRRYNAAMTPDWVTTEYNSMAGSFVAIGSAMTNVTGHVMRAPRLDGLGGVGQANFNPGLGGM